MLTPPDVTTDAASTEYGSLCRRCGRPLLAAKTALDHCARCRFVGKAPYVVIFLILLGGATLPLRHILFRNPTAVIPSTANLTPVSPQGSVDTPPKERLLSKDSAFLALLHPPTGDALLQLSSKYQLKREQIESKLSRIQDSELRGRVSSDEWRIVDKSTYIDQEERDIEAAFPSAMRKLLQKHRADWFEVGQVEYPGTNALSIHSVDTSPLNLPDGVTVSMDITTMDNIFAKFKGIVSPLIEERVSTWLNSDTMRMCRELPGSCSPPTNEEAHRQVESDLRKERLRLVGAGDLILHRIDKLMLVDYVTEEVFLDLPPESLKGTIYWKYPREDQQTTPVNTATETFMTSEEREDFGKIQVGSTKSLDPISLSADENEHLIVTASLVGDVDNSFSFSNGCASDGYHSGGCGIGIEFGPKSAGDRTARLVVNTGSSSKTYTLTGSGIWAWDIYADLRKQ